MKKTNAVRLLEQQNIVHEILEYEVDLNNLSAQHVAECLNIPLEEIFKTLVVQGDKTEIIVCCIPGDKDLALKNVAKLTRNKKVELVPSQKIQELTGYLRGGCSPLAMKRLYKTLIHVTAKELPTIIISAGLRGLQIRLKGEDLAKVLNAEFGTITSVGT